MLSSYLQVKTLSLVFLGDFNPAIFQPAWFSGKNLIREQEARDAKLDVVHNELAKFQIPNWLQFECTRLRCVFLTTQEPFFEPIRDLAIGTFKILKETPIRALGINHNMHYQLPNEKTYYEFGNKLSPLSNWEDTITDPRLIRLEILEGGRKDWKNGQYRINVVPSDIIGASSFGISIGFNHHFAKHDNGPLNSIIDIIEENWESTEKKANSIPDILWNKIWKK